MPLTKEKIKKFLFKQQISFEKKKRNFQSKFSIFLKRDMIILEI